MRPVAMTLAGLAALTLIGLTRHALTDVPRELALAPAPTPVARVATASEAAVPPATANDPANTITVPGQIIVEAETDDPPALFMSEPATATGSSTNASLPETATSFGDASDPHAASPRVQAAVPSSGAGSKSARSRPARHGSSAVWPATVSKARLLSTIRASRPAHGDTRKTL
jgi:hypothetical protein